MAGVQRSALQNLHNAPRCYLLDLKTIEASTNQGSLNQAQASELGYQCASAITEERKWNARQRIDSDVASDVRHHLKGDERRDPRRNQRGEPTLSPLVGTKYAEQQDSEQNQEQH